MTTADDDEKTVTGPTVPGRRAADETVTGIDAERLRGRAATAGLQPGHTLPLGTRLRDYEITGLVGEGASASSTSPGTTRCSGASRSRSTCRRRWRRG